MHNVVYSELSTKYVVNSWMLKNAVLAVFDPMELMIFLSRLVFPLSRILHHISLSIG
jgi:hypothetical protein